MSLSDYLLIALGVLLSMVGQSALIMLTTWLHERHGDEPTCAPRAVVCRACMDRAFVPRSFARSRFDECPVAERAES